MRLSIALRWLRIVLSAPLLVTLSAEARADGWLYWSIRASGGVGSVLRCDPDDCAATQETIVTGAIDPSGIDVDPVDQEVYWVDVVDGVIRKAPAKGGSPELVFDPTPGFSAPALAIDPVNRTVYWRQNAAARIARVGLDGAGLQTVVTAVGSDCPGVCAPNGIAIDAAGSFVYWGDGESSVRRRVTTLTAVGEDVVTTVATSVHGVAIDEANDRLFTGGSAGIESGAISTPPNASVVQAPFIFSGADSIETDEAAGLLYVAQPSGSRILRCSVSDCDEVTDLVEVVTGQSQIGGIALLPSVEPVPVPALPLLGVAGLTVILFGCGVRLRRRRG